MLSGTVALGLFACPINSRKSRWKVATHYCEVIAKIALRSLVAHRPINAAVSSHVYQHSILCIIYTAGWIEFLIFKM